MATQIVGGPYSWAGGRDADGYRTYHVVFQVEGDPADGPAQVLQTPGLPIPGAFWLIDNDIDIWAWCRYDTDCQPEVQGTPNRFWKVSMLFSTKPMGTTSGGSGGGSGGLSGGVPSPGQGHDASSRQRCGDYRIEDPLLELPKVSGSFTSFSKEVTHDRFGIAIVNSALQQVRGSQVEFEHSNPTVRIEVNVASLNLPFLYSFNNSLNDAPLWGLPARTIRCKVQPWERKPHGACYLYYTIAFEFEINIVIDPETGEISSGWDRVLLDEGTKALNGHWNGNKWMIDTMLDEAGIPTDYPDPFVPGSYNEVYDKNGNLTSVILNGYGFPYNPGDADRTFYWTYLLSDGVTANVTHDTFAGAQATVGANGSIYGPFHTNAQAQALIDDNSFYAYDAVQDFPTMGQVRVEYYKSKNFLQLGIPLQI